METRRKQLSELPDDHSRLHGLIRCVDDDGRAVDVEVSVGRRRIGGGGLVKAQVNAMRRGRPLLPSDLYEDETRISVRVEGDRPWQVEVMPNRTYRAGRHHGRTLRALVEELAAHSRKPGLPRP